jgi:hypothetical protein
MFILEHCFVKKSLAALHEAFINEHLDKEMPKKTTHRLVATFRDTGSVCL